MTTSVLIHFPNTVDVKNHLKDLNLNYQQWGEELDVVVNDVPYKNGNHPEMCGIWEDPDVQLCEHYGIDYELVHCIELA